MDYILVTPVRNEADNIQRLITCVASQVVRPKYWLIMNDNSTDESLSIITKASNNYDYITLWNLEPAERDLGWRYHRIMSRGFKKAITDCDVLGVRWSLIGVLDGDIFFKDNDYYSKLISEFVSSKKLGIASGEVSSKQNNGFVIDRNKYRLPRGANRLINRECYQEIGGYPEEPCADSIMRIKAVHFGYNCAVFDHLVAYQSRLTTANRNDYGSGKYVASVKYYLNYSFTYFILKTINYFFSLRFKFAIGFFINYLRLRIEGREKISDPIVSKYFHKIKRL